MTNVVRADQIASARALLADALLAHAEASQDREVVDLAKAMAVNVSGWTHTTRLREFLERLPAPEPTSAISDEGALIDLITHAECGNCQVRTLIDPQTDLPADIETIAQLVVATPEFCSCSDPAPRYLIRSDQAMFGPTVDVDFELVRAGGSVWEYEVDDDLADMVLVSRATAVSR